MYKYPLDMNNRNVQEIIMPTTAYIHSVIIDQFGINVYALVDPFRTDTDIKRFLVAYTGQSIENWQQCNFLASGKDENIGLVYHVFQIY